ncbi:MAG TPA: hypothetical protein VMA95_05275 [Streptosporangiaceae bacterium]|nr:hypothetical protein [Streptosporangiaceae bacterium]
MRLSKLAIATATVACAAAIAVTIWKRAGSSPAAYPGSGTEDLDRFMTREHLDEPEPVR